MRFSRTALACLLSAALMTSIAQAHFIWAVAEPAEQPTVVKVYFGETAAPDDPDLLDNIAAAQAWAIPGGMRRSDPQPLTLKKDGDALTSALTEAQAGAPIVVQQTYGVMAKGDAPAFLLKYYAKAIPTALPGGWSRVDKAEQLPLEITPSLRGADVAFTVNWQGKPAANCQVVVLGPGIAKKIEAATDDKGECVAHLPEGGLYSIRARMTEEAAGELDGKAYQAVRHYSTLSLPYAPAQLTPAAQHWPSLPKGTTSFGGAVAGEDLYVYGGHYGAAHQYSTAGQSGDFLRLKLKQGTAWEPLPGGPKLTGLAMVAHNGKLYRVGGFTARNAENEEESLWSQPDFARFDPAIGTWEALAPLPEGRSSHDAAMIGNTLYVVGGWQMSGEKKDWHHTAWTCDLSQPRPEWKAIPNPPFERRALALAEWQGKLYALGGMRSQGGATTETAVYDPQARTWSSGPRLLGGGMEGFGSSAFAAGGTLYVTTMNGSIQRLSSDGSHFEYLGQLAHPRFFHRLLRSSADELVVVGGASMGTGKIEALERLAVPAADRVDQKAALRN